MLPGLPTRPLGRPPLPKHPLGPGRTPRPSPSRTAAERPSGSSLPKPPRPPFRKPPFPGRAGRRSGAVPQRVAWWCPRSFQEPGQRGPPGRTHVEVFPLPNLPAGRALTAAKYVPTKTLPSSLSRLSPHKTAAKVLPTCPDPTSQGGHEPEPLSPAPDGQDPAPPFSSNPGHPNSLASHSLSISFSPGPGSPAPQQYGLWAPDQLPTRLQNPSDASGSQSGRGWRRIG